MPRYRLARSASIFASLAVLALIPTNAPAQVADDADQWLPRSAGAEWTYAWSNSAYSPAPRTETYRLQARSGATFRLSWQETGTAASDVAAAGAIDFQHTDAGLVNLNYQSTPPAPQFPILCPAARDCGNSLAGAMHLLIWGTRSPVLAEPLLRGTRWSSRGGAESDVASDNRYVGRQRVVVPAFPGGVEAAKVESRITQAGALGDPFGTGVRTVWWVRGVGPVRIELRHAGGELSRAELQRTTLTPRPLPGDANLLPANRGQRAVLRWRNSRYMKRWSTQQFDVVQVVNNSAQVDVKHLSGPIAVAGSYLFSTRLNGVTLLSGATRAGTRLKFPRLGPSGAPAADRVRFVTPYDLMVYGFSPIVPITATPGFTWRSSREGRDWTLFGVTGVSRVARTQRVRTRAGTFVTTPIRSTLTQRGHAFGSGTRTSYFAAGKGLVKLVFRHRDGSVSTVERVR